MCLEAKADLVFDVYEFLKRTQANKHIVGFTIKHYRYSMNFLKNMQKLKKEKRKGDIV